MPDDIFSGIPALDDNAGLEQFVNNNALSDMGLSNPSIPAALQQNQNQNQNAVPEVQGNVQNPATVVSNQNTAANTPQYTAEQVAQIVARSKQIEAQNNVNSNGVNFQQRQAGQGVQPTYSARQAEIIKQLIDRGVPLDRIQQALKGNSNPAQDAMTKRLQAVEQYLQNQQYESELNAFVEKMTTFGDKFGLSEQDLVTFGNRAASMGINLINVSDVEAVFRAVYPEQYAIRTQRMAGYPTSQIYGGTSTPEAPRAAASKLEDAYVDNFLKQAMPNQYNKFPK